MVGALFPIVNLLGNTPILLTLTRGLTGPGRHKLARAIAVNSLILMVASRSSSRRRARRDLDQLDPAPAAMPLTVGPGSTALDHPPGQPRRDVTWE